MQIGRNIYVQTNVPIFDVVIKAFRSLCPTAFFKFRSIHITLREFQSETFNQSTGLECFSVHVKWYFVLFLFSAVSAVSTRPPSLGIEQDATFIAATLTWSCVNQILRWTPFHHCFRHIWLLLTSSTKWRTNGNTSTSQITYLLSWIKKEKKKTRIEIIIPNRWNWQNKKCYYFEDISTKNCQLEQTRNDIIGRK